MNNSEDVIQHYPITTSASASRLWYGLLSLLLLLPTDSSAIDANTLPTHGTIVSGSAQIQQQGNTLAITQQSDKLITQWQNFNIGQAATVTFSQPNTHSVALNRVVSSDPSQIMGKLTANGQLFLLNPNGVYFGPHAQVNAGALVASTLSLSDQPFLRGQYHFHQIPGQTTGSIVNEGQLHAQIIALIAPSIHNHGVLSAPNGTVAMAAGAKVSLDFSGDGLIHANVDEAVLNALIENHHLIQADGGTVIMNAHAAKQLLTTVVNNTGIIQARRLVEKNGRIFLDGGSSGITKIANTLDVSSPDGKAGSIVVTGDKVQLTDDAYLNANGKYGGGSIYIGGGWQGKDTAIRQASATVVMPGARLDASAIDHGNGGTIVAWSDISQPQSLTRAYGRFVARGGPNGGNGGRIETSGHWLDTTGVSGDAGNGGLWLFDPYNVAIESPPVLSSNGAFGSGNVWSPSGTGSTIVNTDINNKLNAGTSITITTGTTGSEVGDIIVEAPISKSLGADATLRLEAANSIRIKEPITSTAGKLHLTLLADRSGQGNGITVLRNSIDTRGGDLKFGDGTKIAINGQDTLVGGDVYINNTAISTPISLTTQGGKLSIYGDVIAAHQGRVIIDTGSGDVLFGGQLNSGNSYTEVQQPTGITWAAARAAAKSGPGSQVGDSYLATITSRLENAAASRSVEYHASWLGAQRDDSTGIWRWVAGPEGLKTDGVNTGLAFFTQDMMHTGGSAINNQYSNWDTGEPNDANSSGPENALQFIGNQGKWNDWAPTRMPSYYVKETNLSPTPLTITANHIIFTGSIGKSNPLGALAISANAIQIDGGAVATSGAQTYRGPVTVSSNTEFISTSAITFQKDLNAAAYTVTLTGGGGGGASVQGLGKVIVNNLLLNGPTPTWLQLPSSFTPQGDYYFNASGNRVTTLAANNAMSVEFSNSQSLTVGTVNGIPGITATAAITLEANGPTSDLTLNEPVTNTNADIVLFAERNFINHVNPINKGIDAQAGRYLVYSTHPDNTTEAMDNYHKHYDRGYIVGDTPSYAGTGNWFLYRVAPIITVTANDNTITYGSADPTLTFTSAGFIGGDTAATIGAMVGTPNLRYAIFSPSRSGSRPVGSYDITPLVTSLRSDLGYQFQPAIGKLTVTKKPLNATFSAHNKAYDGNPQASVATITPNGVAGDEVNINISRALFNDKTVANHKPVTASGTDIGLTGADASNYNPPVSLTAFADISARPLTITFAGNDKVYDGNTAATVTASDDRVSDDRITISDFAAFDSKEVGSNKRVDIWDIRLTGVDAANYALVSTTALTYADITPAPTANTLPLAGIAPVSTPDSRRSDLNAINAAIVEVSDPSIRITGAADTQADGSPTFSPTIGPGAGSTTLTAQAASFAIQPTDNTISVGGMTLSTDSFTTRITVSAAGENRTLSLERAVRGVKKTEKYIKPLAVYTVNHNDIAELGSFVVTENGQYLTLTPSPNRVPRFPAQQKAHGPVVPFSINIIDGSSEKLSVSRLGDNTLLIQQQNPDHLLIDTKMAILTGLTVAEAKLGATINELQSIVLQDTGHH